MKRGTSTIGGKYIAMLWWMSHVCEDIKRPSLARPNGSESPIVFHEKEVIFSDSTTPPKSQVL
jgi:hypothetical protein